MSESADLIESADRDYFFPLWEKIAEKITEPNDWLYPETIGWLYQLATLSMKKPRRQGAGPPENTAAATGLYTPDWIAAYLLDKTLDLRLAECRTAEEIESVTLIDPACGTGHILLPAYRRFEAAYRRLGVPAETIPDKIFSCNLFGLDIDADAVRLAKQLLHLAAGRPPDAENVLIFSFEPVSGRDKKRKNSADKTPFDPAILGSLRILTEKEAKRAKKGMLRSGGAEKLLAARYDCVVTNPPYSGPKGIPVPIKDYAAQNGFSGTGNLDTLFIERAFSLAKPSGKIGMITTQGWMFLSTFARFRRRLLSEVQLEELAHFGTGAFPSLGGEVVSSAAFILTNRAPKPDWRPVFYQRTDSGGKRQKFSEKGRFQHRRQSDFSAAGGCELFYTLSEREAELLNTEKRFGEFFDVRQGMATGDNERFLRYWFEVRPSYRPAVPSTGSRTNREQNRAGKTDYRPYAKGEGSRRWYSDVTDLIDWRGNGAAVRNFRPKAVIRNSGFFFREALAWTFVGTGPMAVRYREEGAVFDVGASSIFPKKLPPESPLSSLNEKDRLLLALGFLNSGAASKLIGLLNPSVNFQVGDLVRLPFDPEKTASIASRVLPAVKTLLAMEQKQATIRESSVLFTVPSLLLPEIRRRCLRGSLDRLVAIREEEREKHERAEKENESAFQEIFSLDSVPVKKREKNPFDPVLIRRAGITDLLSYAAGTALGRYPMPAFSTQEKDFPEGTVLHKIAQNGFFLQKTAAAESSPLADAVFEILSRLFDDNGDELLGITAETFGWRRNPRTEWNRYFNGPFWTDHQRRFLGRPVYWRFSIPDAGLAVCFHWEAFGADLLNRLADVLEISVKKAASITKRLRDAALSGGGFCSESDSRRLKIQLSEFFLSEHNRAGTH